jgi:hypothetical protein
VTIRVWARWPDDTPRPSAEKGRKTGKKRATQPPTGKTTVIAASVDTGDMVPTSHRIFPRIADGQAVPEPLVVSIDLSDIAFT